MEKKAKSKAVFALLLLILLFDVYILILTDLFWLYYSNFLMLAASIFILLCDLALIYLHLDSVGR